MLRNQRRKRTLNQSTDSQEKKMKRREKKFLEKKTNLKRAIFISSLIKN